ncbi:MAG TPA: GPW/gp25 family protein [Flavipsychrobacter sp.]|nr:GPW/gp25 family protein [Flavipsychrobacter sp.]
MNKLYQMPIKFGKLMERNQELVPCNLGTSIAQNIFLIISSKFQEHRFDSSFGCELWDKDFELITNPLVWQEQVNQSIYKSLNKYEQRLERLDVDTTVSEEPYQNPVTQVRSIKKRITISVKGVIKATGEDFAFAPQLFLSPISID